MTKGIIFDFNGTLFWDTHLHDEAWMAFGRKYGLDISKQYLRESLHGKVNDEILRNLFGQNISDREAKDYSEEKEKIYQDIVHKKNAAQLAPGVTKVLDNLKARNTPMAIATSSTKQNVDFYKKIFDLHKWFPDDRIIFYDGSFNGKPAPDIFLIAAESLHMQPQNCIVVEDTITGIQSALAAGVGQIFLIESGNHLAWDNSNEKVKIIDSFTRFDPKL